MRESSGRDDGSSLLFSSPCVAANLIISEKNVACNVRVCVVARRACVPELTLFFARPLSTLTLETAGTRCHVIARRCTSHRRTHRVLDGARVESRPSCCEKLHLWKKKCDTAFPQLHIDESPVSRAHAANTWWFVFVFPFISVFESLTVDSAFFVARLLFCDRFFLTLSDSRAWTNMQGAF